MSKVDKDNTNDAIASPEVLGTTGADGTAGGAACASGPGSGTVCGFAIDSFGGGTAGGGGMTIVFRQVGHFVFVPM